jgi:ABC-type antimicrobial peptide transport system permease subunit
LAAGFAQKVPLLIPPDIAVNIYLPMPILSAASLGMALACALLVALLSTAIPVLRLMRLDIAGALSEQ